MLCSFGSAACREKVYKFSYKNYTITTFLDFQNKNIARRLYFDLKILYLVIKLCKIQKICRKWLDYENMIFGLALFLAKHTIAITYIVESLV